MIGSESSIVLQHQDLQFKEFLDETPGFNKFWFDMDGSILEIVAGSITDDVVNEPVGRLVLLVLVSIDFLLIVRPVWQRLRVSP